MRAILVQLRAKSENEGARPTGRWRTQVDYIEKNALEDPFSADYPNPNPFHANAEKICCTVS